MSNKINNLIKSVEALVYYSQISTVSNVRPVNMPTHDQAWRDAQKWVWDNCQADTYGNYCLKDTDSIPTDYETLKAENSKMRQALEEAQVLAKRGIFPHLPVEVVGAQMCIDIDKLITEALKKDSNE